MSKLKKKRLVASSKKGPRFSPKERLGIGLACLHSMDDSAADRLADKYGCSRSHVYKCRQLAAEFMSGITDDMITGGCFVMDNNMRDAMIITLTFACHSSIEGIQQFFEMVFDIHLSIGTISQTISHYSSIAEKITEDYVFDNVETIASDEIYMGHDAPILVVIDPVSTAPLMIKPEEKLSAEIWEEDLKKLSERSKLNPKVAVNDSGSALMKGIPMAFKGIEMQPDIFHTEIELGYELAKFTNYVEALINEEAELERTVKTAQKKHRKTIERLEAVRTELAEVLSVADTVITAYEGIKKDFGFTGCRYDDAVSNADAKLKRMLDAIPSLTKETGRICSNDPSFAALSDAEKEKRLNEKKSVLLASRKWKRYNSLRSAIHKLEKRIRKEGIFGFLERLEKQLKSLAKEHRVPEDLVFEAYRLYTIRDKDEYLAGYDELFEKYYVVNRANCLDEILLTIRYLISHTIRASSLVENTNHKIRPYIDMKKNLTSAFCCLLQLYLINKPYRRSVKGRAGKTPMELLTGKKAAPFLEQLGIA